MRNVFRTIVQGLIVAVLAIMLAQYIERRLPPEPVAPSPAAVQPAPVIATLDAEPAQPEFRRGGYEAPGGSVGGRDMSGDRHRRTP